MMKTFVGCVLIAALCCPVLCMADGPQTEATSAKQCIVWSSGDRDVALKLVYMYTYNAKKQGWMDEVRLLVWGPSAKLLSVDRELQSGLEQLEEAGVELLACKACADSYGVSEELEKLGITVEMQKTGWHVLTF